jgi:hypothetical protein
MLLRNRKASEILGSHDGEYVNLGLGLVGGYQVLSNNNKSQQDLMASQPRRSQSTYRIVDLTWFWKQEYGSHNQSPLLEYMHSTSLMFG